ncbi:probable RNA polymerase II nuclear localization protein SLC7A6OS [Phaenicophaeus curvirostris]|uniref:probable RNA polymerase II nuclear localization protein SLC7A6OS n=1 Tax=Phaenicophaeus curvirostris TaxID=33595 RepID=UPI0037F0CCEC
MAGAAVLRVRRKRGGDPAGALLLACKRLRTEGDAAARPVERSLFRLVATVPSKNEPVQKYVQEAATRKRVAQKLRPSAGSAQRIVQGLRSSTQTKSKENRYHVVASHRPDCTGTVAVPAANGKASADGGRSGLEATEDAAQRESGAVDNSSAFHERFQLFDIEQEEEMVGDSSAATAGSQTTEKDVILCNTVEMIRERLNVSEDGEKEQHEKDDEYVYDIYCMETSAPGWIQNILSVQPYREEYELVDDYDRSEEVYDDEDDENDENNWRNDYPDEDELQDFLPGEDGDREFEDSSSDEDRPYRRRIWHKYQPEILQEFGYDDMEDADSDGPL